MTKISKRSYLAAVGRRKTAVARIRMHKNPTEGKIIINDKDYKEYFPSSISQEIVNQSLKAISRDKYNISIKVLGGGTRSQAEAVSLGLARVLEKEDKELRTQLKPLGLLKRDPRVKERKKYGLKRARRAPQWQKR